LKKEKKQKLFILFKEFLLIAGAGLVWYGLFLIYKPMSYIILGCGLIWFAYPRQVK